MRRRPGHDRDQRAGPSTGLPTLPAQGDIMQARWGTHGDHPIIVLTAASVQGVLEGTIRAFDLVERFRTPVILLLDQVIGQMRERVEVPDPSEVRVFGRVERGEVRESAPHVLPMGVAGKGDQVHATGLTHRDDGLPTLDPVQVDRLIRRLHAKILESREEIEAWKELRLEDARVVLVAFGCVARSAAAAVGTLRRQGVAAGLLELGTLYPLPEQRLREVAQQADLLVVPEMNLGQLVLEVERLAAGRAPVLPVNQVDGRLLRPEPIVAAVALAQGGGGVGAGAAGPEAAGPPQPGPRKAYTEVLIAGAGGQGVILAGTVLAEAAAQAGLHVVATQSYGPESRGGACRAAVILRPEPVHQLEVTEPDLFIALSASAATEYGRSLPASSTVLVDADLVPAPPRGGGRTLAVPFTRIVQELGAPRAANMVALGALLGLGAPVSPETLREAVGRRAPQGTRERNLAAFEAGARWLNGARGSPAV